MRKPVTAVLCLTTAALALAGCGLTQSNSAGDGKIAVTSTDDGCNVSAAEAPSGNLSFAVKNDGSKVSEFYLYGSDGLRIVGEIENIGPGLSRDLVVTAGPGSYITSCRPGMKGEGIRSDFKVTDSGKDVQITGVDQATINQAVASYTAYVRDQTSQLVDQTTEFVNLYTAGKDDEARALFPVARQHWERVEPVAESFGDLDPKTDAREADLEPGQKWTGWHRIEKDLWPPASGYTALTPAQRKVYANDLLANVKTLDKRVQTLKLTVDQIGNGSKGLLDEVASGKITGEEDTWSHTDLYDFQANVDGARVAYEDLKPILDVKNKSLSDTIQQRFSQLQALLDKYRDGDGFVFYDKVTEAQRKELSDAVNALSEPLSKMTGAITL